MPDEHRDVDRRRLRAASREIVANRQRRAAVLTEQDGGDALRDLRVGLGIRVQAVGRVVVRIDEAWREDQASPVNDAIGRAGNR